MKIIKRILLISILLIIYVYTLIISYIPDNLVVFEGENLKINTILGIDLKAKDNYETVLTSSNVNNKSIDQIGNTKLSVNLFKKFFIKDVNVSVIPKTKVIPLGNLAGVKLYTSGVLVVGMSEIEGVDNNKYKPYENSGIEEGDMIVEIDNTAITCTTDLINTVNKSAGKELCIEFVRDGKTEKCNMTPTKTEENEYKLGLWVRDSAAGVGTVTFYEPSTQMFGALGHGITVIDTDKLTFKSTGEIDSSSTPSSPGHGSINAGEGIYINEAENKYNDFKNVEDTVFIIQNKNRKSKKLRITIQEVNNYAKYNTSRLAPKFVKFQATIGDNYIPATQVDKNSWVDSDGVTNYIIYEGTIEASSRNKVALALYVDYANLDNSYQNKGFIGTIKIYVDDEME